MNVFVAKNEKITVKNIFIILKKNNTWCIITVIDINIGVFMRIVVLASAGYASNSYLIVDDDSKSFAVVDSSVDTSSAMPYINDGYSLKYVLLTHGHFDHIFYVDEWRSLGGKVCIHFGDAEFLGDPSKSLYLQFFARDIRHRDADVILRDGSKLFLGNNTIDVISTPGHTKGSVCYIFDGVMVSGDTLFAGSIARTDLYGSSNVDMKESIEKLSAINTDYTVYPGHGDKTTLFYEKKHGFLHE